jgi:hypothetical protein
VLGQQARHQGRIANVALHKNVACIALQGSQRLAVAGVAQDVEVDQGFIRLRQPVQHKVGPDKARTTRY